MEKYSASYANTKCNFVFQNIYNNNVVNEYYGAFCILKNIIQRGTPTIPSIFLKEKLGQLQNIDDNKLYLISNNKNKWFNTIKGNDENTDNPALFFFENILPKYLGEYSYVRQLIIPEAQIDDIIEPKNSDFYEQQVDFYIPQAKIVIEIDGYQHKSIVQKQKDNVRDTYLYKNGIKTIRITTNAIKTDSDELKLKMREILNSIKDNEEIENYKKSLFNTEKSEIDMLRIKYDIVMRFQLLIISLLQKNLISVGESKWKFSLIESDETLIDLFEIAIEDLFIWLKHIFNLLKISFNKPNISISKYIDNNEDNIIIDFSIYERWTDEAELNRDIIYVRNDYFDEKDYFEVSITEAIKYKFVLEGIKSDIPNLLFILENIFGFNEFRDGQLPVIVNTLERNDTIGILPTGAGKSLCYQFAAMLQPCISFVVCPILALIYDQNENLSKKGINRTSYITSEVKAKDKNVIMNNFKKGKYFFIWISPERFQNEAFRESLEIINMDKNFALAVIDEVHCLSEWGHDFRTSYLTLIKTIKNYCPGASLLGLTATASQFVLNDLKNEFEIESSNIKTIGSMNREELDFHVVNVGENNKYQELKNLLVQIDKKYDNRVFNIDEEDIKCGLIFTVNKNGKDGCVNIARDLDVYLKKSKELPINVKCYHGSLLSEEKKKIQDEYKDDKYTLMVATKAFGMGVDKSNIRYTIHYGLPWSIEAFYQEAGRAGRGNNKELAKSDCYILYKPEICDSEITNKIFDIDTNIEELEGLCKPLKNDLSNIMFLWKLNTKGVTRDLEVAIWIAQKIYTQQDNLISCNMDYPKSEVEKAIYRLSVLGIIWDWTIEEWGEYTAKIKIYQNDYTIESVKENLFNYIKRYDPEFSDKNVNSKNDKYFKILQDASIKPFVRYIKMLLQWSYDNIVYNRRQAIKNMKECCDKYEDSISLKKYIENYFGFTDKTIILDQISYNPKDYLNWFNIFSEFRDNNGIKEMFPISKLEIDSLIPSLQRYLESYRYNTGLNYISGISRLLYGNFNDTDGEARFEEAFNSIDKFEKDDFENIISKTLEIMKNASQVRKELLGGFLIKRYPKKAVQIYEALEDNESLAIILDLTTEKIKKIKENIIW